MPQALQKVLHIFGGKVTFVTASQDSKVKTEHGGIYNNLKQHTTWKFK